MTFVVNPQVVLREADVAELVLGAPGSGQRRLLFIHGRVEPSEPALQLLLLLVQGRVSVLVCGQRGPGGSRSGGLWAQGRGRWRRRGWRGVQQQRGGRARGREQRRGRRRRRDGARDRRRGLRPRHAALGPGSGFTGEPRLREESRALAGCCAERRRTLIPAQAPRVYCTAASTASAGLAQRRPAGPTAAQAGSAQVAASLAQAQTTASGRVTPARRLLRCSPTSRTTVTTQAAVSVSYHNIQ